MLSLDDEDDLIDRRPVGAYNAPTGRTINLRPILMGVAVIVLGGGLGVGAYLLSSLDTRDIIAVLDVGDQPRLSLAIPGRKGELTPPPMGDSGGALLTPPGAAAVPLPQGEAAGIAALPMTPPLKADPPAPPPVAALAVPVQPAPRNPDQPPTYASLPARLGEAKPLAAAPLAPLLRQSANGPLPVIAGDGRQSWKVYARPFDAPAAKPRLSVIVTGLGLDRDATEAAIFKLPPDVTLAFSPYAGGLDKWIKRARDAGHEVMLVLPTEPAGFPALDPGPWGLLSGNPVEENIARLEHVLGRAGSYVGVFAPDGNFVRSPKLAPVLMALRERGLLYVGDGVKDAGLANAAVSAILDPGLFRDAIEARLTQAARTARTAGHGMVVASPSPVAFDRLVHWLDGLSEQGIVLAPASAVVKQTGKS